MSCILREMDHGILTDRYHTLPFSPRFELLGLSADGVLCEMYLLVWRCIRAWLSYGIVGRAFRSSYSTVLGWVLVMEYIAGEMGSAFRLLLVSRRLGILGHSLIS